MHFLYRISIFLIMFLTTQTLWACIPHSPDDVFVSRLQSSQPTLIDNQQKGFELQFSNHRFVFRTLKTWFMYSTPKQWQSDFELKGIKPNDLVIGLAYHSDGGKPAEYTVVSLATLSCENDKLKLGKPLVPFLAWNRAEGKCGHHRGYKVGILDGFTDEDQAYYLQQLQAKYPSCNKLNAAFPIISDNELKESASLTKTHESGNHAQLSFWDKLKRWFGQWV